MFGRNSEEQQPMTDKPELKIVYLPVDELRGYERNSRLHSEEQIKQLEKSIIEFGFTNPILIDESKTIIAGHGRLQAATNLHHAYVPTITLQGLSEAQIKALVIADNKLALNATWDFEMLMGELETLGDMDIDINVTGFDQKELDKLFGTGGSDDNTPGTVKIVGDRYLLQLEFQSEAESEKVYEEMKQRGIECKIIM